MSVLFQVKATAKKTFRAIRTAALSQPERFECNACGWRGRRFLSDGFHEDAECPRCESRVRHRLLLAVLKQGSAGFSLESAFRGQRVLHFAPEAPLVRIFRPFAARYVTADLFAPGCDLRLDLADLAGVVDAAYDVVIACDVLEHVENDRRALREIQRVLAPGGLAVLMVPQKDGLEITFEDAAVTTPEQRERAYGLANHHRIYGTDFASRLAAAGFDATVVDHGDLASADVERHILFPRAPSPHPLATNHRRIYFARKS